MCSVRGMQSDNWYQTQALPIWCPARFCMVSDQHCRVLYPTLFDKRAGVFYVLGDDSPNTRDQQLYVVSEPREIHSLPMLRARF